MTKTGIYPTTYYNNADDSYIPDFTLRASIDWLTISYIHFKYLMLICDLLNANGFTLTKDNPLAKSKFNRIKEYCDNDICIQLFYDMRINDKLIPTIVMKIHDPNKEILQLFHNYFNKFPIFHKLSQIELTFDFNTNEHDKLRELLNNHLYLKYQKQQSFNIEDTFYTTDIRKATKGTRTYIKEINGSKFVRMELLLNRRIIRHLGLSLPLSDIDTIDLKKYFKFAYVDSRKLINYYKNRSKDDIKRLNKRRPGYGNLIVRHIANWAYGITRREYETEFIKQIETLKDKEKGVPNYWRFIVEHELLTNTFMSKLSETSFLPTTGKDYVIPDTL